MTEEVSNRNALALSRLGPRATYGQTLLALAEQDERIVAMSADLGGSSGLDRFRARFPDRFINVGIAEQHLIGMASGIAQEGFVVYASSFAPFLSMRAAEQIRMNIGYMKSPVKLVALGSGLSMGLLGNSHFGLEDIGVLRTIPDLAIVAPADPLELSEVLKWSTEYEGALYLRLTGVPGSPHVPNWAEKWAFGKIQRLSEGSDCAIVGTGSMVPIATQTAVMLEHMGWGASIYNCHTLKPFDIEAATEILESFEHVFVVEEHSRVGGLVSLFAEVLLGWSNGARVHTRALPDQYGPTGRYEYLLKHHGLDQSSLVDWVSGVLSGS